MIGTVILMAIHCFKANPANIYLLKVNNRNTRKGGKYVQS